MQIAACFGFPLWGDTPGWPLLPLRGNSPPAVAQRLMREIRAADKNVRYRGAVYAAFGRPSSVICFANATFSSREKAWLHFKFITQSIKFRREKT